MSKVTIKNKVVVFSDTTGRILIGRVKNQTTTEVVIDNPMIVQAQDRGNNQMAIGFIPYTYLELFNPDSDSSWSFPINSISIALGDTTDETVKLYNSIIERYNESRLQFKQSNGAVDDNVVAEEGNVIDFNG